MRKRAAARSFLIPKGLEGAPSWPLGLKTYGVGLGVLSQGRFAYSTSGVLS